MKSPPYSSEFRNESCFTHNPGCILKNEVLHSPKPTLIFKRLKQCIYIYIYMCCICTCCICIYKYICVVNKNIHENTPTNRSRCLFFEPILTSGFLVVFLLAWAIGHNTLGLVVLLCLVPICFTCIHEAFRTTRNFNPLGDQGRMTEDLTNSKYLVPFRGILQTSTTYHSFFFRHVTSLVDSPRMVNC